PQAALPHRGPTSPDPTPGKTVLANLLNRLVPSLLASMPSSQLESENRRAGNPSRDSNSNRSTLAALHTVLAHGMAELVIGEGERGGGGALVPAAFLERGGKDRL